MSKLSHEELQSTNFAYQKEHSQFELGTPNALNKDPVHWSGFPDVVANLCFFVLLQSFLT